MISSITQDKLNKLRTQQDSHNATLITHKRLIRSEHNRSQTCKQCSCCKISVVFYFEMKRGPNITKTMFVTVFRALIQFKLHIIKCSIITMSALCPISARTQHSNMGLTYFCHTAPFSLPQSNDCHY